MNVSELINNKINKSDFIQYKFSDFAENIVEKIIPRESGLKHYIGLEHLDSGSIKINRFGDPQSLKGDKLKIYKGDIIFAKRNAYLKRASMAEFDAVASAHSMVLRAKSDIVLPEFLPLFMQSDSFWDVAIRISVGGLSPTINWKAMAKQEFLLPPKDQQAKIAKLLWAMDDVVISEDVELLKKINTYKYSLLKNFFNKSKDTIKIKDFGEVITGSTPSTKIDEFWNGDIPFVTPADINENIYVSTTERKITNKGLDATRKIPANSVAVVCIASIGKISITTSLSATNQQINSILPHDHFNSIYIYYTLKHFSNKLISFAGNSVVPIINKHDFENIKVPIIEKNDREMLVKEMIKIDNSIMKLKIKIQQSKQLQKSLINEIFSS